MFLTASWCLDNILGNFFLFHILHAARLLRNIQTTKCLANVRLWMKRCYCILYFILDFSFLRNVFKLIDSHFFTSSQAGKYEWKTYKEIYDIVIKLGNSLRSCGFEEVNIHIYIYIYNLQCHNCLICGKCREENVVSMVQIVLNGS